MIETRELFEKNEIEAKVDEITSKDFILNHLRACVVDANNEMLSDGVVYREFCLDKSLNLQ